MTKTMIKVALMTALFCGTIFADGNMGGGGYTDCGGTNPPPTCDCNSQTPPPSCGGFAGMQTTEAKVETDMFTVVGDFVVYVLEIF